MLHLRALATRGATSLKWRPGVVRRYPWYDQKYSRIYSHQYCTKLPGDEDPEVLRFISASKEDLIREVYVNDDGEEVLTVEANAPFDNSFDWNEFEQRLGLNDIDDADVDEAWERLQRKYGMKPKKTEEKFEHASKRAVPKVKHRNFDSTGKVFRDVGISIEYCDEEPREAHEYYPLHAHDDSTPSQETNRDSSDRTDSLQHAVSPRPSRKLRTIETELPSDTDGLQQPVNRKRPGYERRVMSMEREMEKIAGDVLCDDNCEWYAEGGNVERVLLSPNMKNLTIYYTLDSASKRSPSWWRKINTRSAATLRSALSQRLVTKYVPRVFFEPQEDGLSSAVDNKSQIDTLFEQIAAERSENSPASEELEVK